MTKLKTQVLITGVIYAGNYDLIPKGPSAYLGNPILVVLAFRRSYNIFQAVITYLLQ